MPKGLKIWLWIVLFMDIITFIYYGRLFLLGLSAAAACMIPELLQITGVSIVLSLINSVVVPLVIYALMKPYWNCFR